MLSFIVESSTFLNVIITFLSVPPLKISRSLIRLGKERKKTFDMFIFICLSIWSPSGVYGVEVKSVFITEGDSVTLESALTEIQSDDLIMWRFGPKKEILLATISRKDNKAETDSSDGRFRDRLKLDSQTGSLIITNSRISDSGLYTVTSISSNIPLNTFSLTVYVCLPFPDIIRDCSSSVQYCSVLCSVVNVSAVSLSWYKGNSVLSSITVSDLSISLSLPLVVKYQDNNTYICVVNNTISNQTQHLDINTLCQPCPDQGLALLYTLLPSAGGFLLMVSLVFWIYRKQRKTDQEVVESGEEITYADPTFYKRKAQKTRVVEERDVVYSGVAMKH